jgi:putative Mg2+ transporter-C (MgtC) family protein
VIPAWALILRIAVGALLGGAIGFERDRHGRQAGLRTHLLVAMASATFMVVSAHFAFHQAYGQASHIGVDPSRIAASVVSGIGFLAGGVILKSGLNVRGLTTAAGLWLVGAIGLAAGAGMYLVALAVTLMGLVALTLLRMLEVATLPRLVSLTLDNDPEVLRGLLATLDREEVRVYGLTFERPADGRHLVVQFEARLPARFGAYGIYPLLERQPGVRGLKVLMP